VLTAGTASLSSAFGHSTRGVFLVISSTAKSEPLSQAPVGALEVTERFSRAHNIKLARRAFTEAATFSPRLETTNKSGEPFQKHQPINANRSSILPIQKRNRVGGGQPYCAHCVLRS